MIKPQMMKKINYKRANCCSRCTFSEQTVFGICYSITVCTRLKEQVEKIEDAQVFNTSVCDYYKEQQ